MPDGYHMYTATDIPGENRIAAMGTSIPVFTPYEIQYFGEPLGIIVGPELQKVQELVSEVLIETELLKPLPFSEKFAASQVVAKRVSLSGDPDKALGRRKMVFESTCSIGMQDHFYAEPLGAHVSISAGRLNIHTATQWPFHVQRSVSAVLDLAIEDIVVTPTELGEAMDGKIWFPSLIAAQAALAAVLSKKSVKIVFSRQEDFLFSVKSAPVQFRHRTALAEDGSIEAMEVRILVNAGAYSPLIDEILDRMVVAATGMYAVPQWRIEAYALRTNVPPMGVLSGWGEAPALFALENHLSAVISTAGFGPVEWKLLNIVRHGEVRTTKIELLGESAIEDLFTTVCSESDFPRKYASYEVLNRAGKHNRGVPIRGIGIALGFQGNGFLGGGTEFTRYAIEMTIDTDGKVFIKSGLFSRSMQKIMIRMASELLTIDEDHIFFSGRDTDSMTPTGPDTLSVKAAILSALTAKCCAAIQKLRFRQPLPITVKKSWKPSRAEQWNTTTLEGKPFYSITPAVCAVEIELDPLTYETAIRGIWMSIDAGRILSPDKAASTIRKTVPLALSRLLAEHIVEKDGKLATRDGACYDLLSPVYFPESQVIFTDSESSARGIGTLAYNLVPSAYAAAVRQITGSSILSMPIETEAIFKAMVKPEADS